MDTDLFDLQDGCPNASQLFLERRSRSEEGARRGAATFESQLRRQANALYFAGRAFREPRDDEHLAWKLEVSDAAYAELTYVFQRRDTVGLQDDRRGNVLPQRGMWDGKGYDLCHRWMFQQYFVDFLWGDFLPTAIDDFPHTANEKQV